ncbi:MAG: 4Fe-4S dicluster domain-containing protein [Desulfuromonadales bacterium]
MFASTFPSYPFEQVALDELLDTIRAERALWAPQTGADGHCRLQPMGKGSLPSVALTTFLPLKKLLLPPCEEIWSFRSGEYWAVQVPQAFAVVGVPLCDLQAVWYLDQAFADDVPYQARRAQALLVGMACVPGPECRCDGQSMPLSGDLFVDQKRVWALSPAGQALLRACGCQVSQEMPLSWPVAVTGKRRALTQEQFFSTTGAAIWADEAKRCLSCGACSAVCPTCYCFDMLDAAALDGSVIRQRSWDNCFFAEHGKVAGDYDFRPGRANRLRFRMEHKRFGFGALRGQNSCVGCGRCRKVCPVDIDLDQIAERLDGEGGS